MPTTLFKHSIRSLCFAAWLGSVFAGCSNGSSALPSPSGGAQGASMMSPRFVSQSSTSVVVAKAVVFVRGSHLAKVPIGKSTSLPVTVKAYDAGGHLIVAPAKYSSPITVSDTDRSVVTSFSSQRKTGAVAFDGPGTTASLYYNGNGGALFRAALMPSVNGKPQINSSGVMRTTGYPAVKEYPVATVGGSSPLGLVVGSDNALWFAEQSGPSGSQTGSSNCLVIIASSPECSYVGRMTIDRAATSYPIQLAQSSGEHTVVSPGFITAGPDGALWVTGHDVGQIGRITTLGVTTSIYRTPVVGPSGFTYPAAITAGPDDALWYTDLGGHAIGRLTTNGSFVTYALSGAPYGITAGPDGALWFTDVDNGAIGRITTSGKIREYTTPTANSYPTAITAGPDGALWFTEYCTSRIGRITTNGQIHEIPLPAGAKPWDIVGGPDGALWATDQGAKNLARVTTDGSIIGFPMPSTRSNVNQIVVGPDGALWFADSGTNKIGRLP